MFNLRPYQEEALRSVLTDFQQHQKLGIVLPTGAGKTECFIAIASEWLRANKNRSVLILSHLSLLTTQTHRRFRERAPHLVCGINQAQTQADPNCDVVISTMQSSRTENRTDDLRRRLRKPVGMVIVDEAHYLTTDSYDKALSYFPDAKILGVTATPFRDKRIMLNFFDKVSYSLSMQRLIDDGYLVKPELQQVVADTEDAADRMALVLQTYRAKEAGKKAVVFLTTKDDAEAMRNAFVNEGIKASCVTSDVVDSTRDRILESFREGDTQVLTTVNVLSAGFDAPCLEAIFMPFMTGSPTLYMQRVGRGLRPYKNKQSCRVYVCGDAPSIARGVYMKAQKLALEGKRDWQKGKDLRDELILNQGMNTEQYHWTERVVAVANKLERWHLGGISELLVTKQFPKRYMEKLDDIVANIPMGQIYLSHVPPTEKQIGLLNSWGFDPTALQDMDKGEASALISSILSIHQKDQQAGVITSGKFAGKMVSELPFAYKQFVMNNYPNSHVARMIREHERKRA